MSKGVIGPLVVVGGREDKDGDSEILQEFVRLAGGRKAHIAILPVATDQPEESSQEYQKVFSELGAGKSETVLVSTREAAFDERSADVLRRATGVFFTGGSQVRITSMLGGSPLDSILRERQLDDGLVIAGTSAGASVMADLMIVAGEQETGPKLGQLELGAGLGFVHNTIIDQHFAERGRIHRLIAAVAQNPRYLGVGIDENTALIVEDAIFRVIGEGSVTVVDASQMRYNNFVTVGDAEPLALEGIRLTIVPPGYGFVMAERRLLHKSSDVARQNGDENGATGSALMEESGRTVEEPGAGSPQKSKSAAARVRRKSIEAHGGGK